MNDPRKLFEGESTPIHEMRPEVEGFLFPMNPEYRLCGGVKPVRLVKPADIVNDGFEDLPVNDGDDDVVESLEERLLEGVCSTLFDCGVPEAETFPLGGLPLVHLELLAWVEGSSTGATTDSLQSTVI